MTLLRQRMVDAMVTRGFALRTQESYVEAMARVANIEAMQCPYCRVGTLWVVAPLAGCQRLPAPDDTTDGQARHTINGAP